MYTADNILGLKVTHRNNDDIHNPGVQYTIIENGVNYYQGHNLNNPMSARYTMSDMAQYINEGTWIVIDPPVNNTFPIY